MQVRLPLSTGTLYGRYLRGINHRSIGLSTHYDYYHNYILLSCVSLASSLFLGYATIGPFTRINVSFTEFYELVIKLLRKNNLFRKS